MKTKRRSFGTPYQAVNPCLKVYSKNWLEVLFLVVKIAKCERSQNYFRNFKVGGEDDDYRLTIGEYNDSTTSK